ncbi:MAG: hypothetical protein II889_03915 [Clostridia bacterium]|nr:hypothetical protein [Clostridia bacterium]
MGIGLVIAGLIMLFNPVVIVVDVIPDAVGFFLITAGLTKMSCFIGKIEEARQTFLKLAFVEVVKLFSIVILPYASGSADVLLAFVFGLIEGFLFVPAITALFEGLSFAALWYGGTAVYAKRETVRGGKTKTVETAAATKRYIIFFYLFRIVATLIPELTELQMYDNIGTVDARIVRMTAFKPLLYILFGAVTMIFAVIYIVKVVRFFGPIRRDKPFLEALTRKYERDILPKTTFFIAKRMKIALMLFGASALASFIFTLDNVNVLVGAISSGLLIAAAVIVARYVKTAYITIVLAAVRAALSVFNMILEIRYFMDYSPEATLRVTEAYTRYYRIAMLETVEHVLALASVLFFLAALMKAVKGHLEISGIQTDNAMYSKHNRDLETYNTIGGKLLLLSVLAIIHDVMCCAFRYLLVNLPAVLVICTAVTIVYVAYAIYSMSVIDNLLYDKEIEMS